MKLRGIDFGNVLGAAGVQGFYGEGYPFHRLLGPLGPKFDGMTFVSKTSTLYKNAGNMPLRGDLQPAELSPECIWANPLRGIALNAVGLSGPGIEALLARWNPDGTTKTNRWQMRLKPFFISFMPIGKTKEERYEETKRFVELVAADLPTFRAKVGVQFNLTCPNVGLDTGELVAESRGHLDILAALNVPIMLKINLLVPAQTAVEISGHPACDAICTTNAIPFGKWDKIDWNELFPFGSPLKKFGGGGLSGGILFPHLCGWVSRAFTLGMKKPLNAGGGIMQWDDIDLLKATGLRPDIDSVFIGTVAMLRPWRVQGIINQANFVLGARPC